MKPLSIQKFISLLNRILKLIKIIPIFLPNSKDKTQTYFLQQTQSITSQCSCGKANSQLICPTSLLTCFIYWNAYFMTLFPTHLQWNPFQVINNNAKQNVLKKIDLRLLLRLFIKAFVSCHKLWKNKQKDLLWSHFWIDLRGTSYWQHMWIPTYAKYFKKNNTSTKLLS